MSGGRLVGGGRVDGGRWQEESDSGCDVAVAMFADPQPACVCPHECLFMNEWISMNRPKLLNSKLGGVFEPQTACPNPWIVKKFKD